MKIKAILSENLYCSFIAFCSTLLSETIIFDFFQTQATLEIFITSVIFIVLTLVLYVNRRNSAVYIGILALFTVILWALSTAGISAVKFTADAYAHFISGTELIIGEKILITSVISFVLTVFFFLTSKIKYFRYTVAVLAVAALIICGIKGKMPSFSFTFAASGLIICELSELSLGLMYKNENKDKLSHIISFLLPVFMLFSFTVAIIPSSEKPLDWSFVKNAAESAVNMAEDIAADISYALNSSSGFNIGFQGYSDSNDFLGGAIAQSDTSQLLLTCGSAPHSSVYLIGSVCDTFNGNGWSNSVNTNIAYDDYYLDYCETICAFERNGISADKMKNVVSSAKITVEYDRIATKSLFYPLKTSSFMTASDFNATLPSVTFTSRAKKGTRYSLDFLEINFASEEFREIAESEFNYTDNNHITDHYLNQSIPVGIESELSQRSRYIKENYTALPDSVTKRTYDLANKITSKYTNNYDKLCALEAYLRDYEYTLTPDKVPDGKDPIDYFLFESKKGYCTYFASSMAVLARCVNIPTRYVQGFSADCGNNGSFINYTVTAACAHAWTEAYFEGLGWIPFEPTPSMRDSRYNYRSNVQSSYNPDDYSRFERPSDYTANPLPEAAEPNKDENVNTSSYLPVVVISILFIITVSVMFVFIRIRSFFSMYKRSNETEKFLICYKMSYNLLGRKKLIPKVGETAAKFTERVCENSEKSLFPEVTETFDRIRYGNGKPSNEELKKAEKYLTDLYDELKKSRGKIAAMTAFAGYCLKRRS